MVVIKMIFRGEALCPRSVILLKLSDPPFYEIYQCPIIAVNQNTKYKYYLNVAQYVIFLQIDDNVDVLTNRLACDVTVTLNDVNITLFWRSISAGDVL